MGETCWGIWPDRGFLAKPDPASSLANVPETGRYLVRQDVECLEQIAGMLPQLIASREFRDEAGNIPLVDFEDVRKNSSDELLERLILLYSYFANAFVFEEPRENSRRLPAQIARPLYLLTAAVERPPLLAYPSYILNNWRRIDDQGPIRIENLELVQSMQGGEDEAWFVLIHVEIEALASKILQSIKESIPSQIDRDFASLEAHLLEIAAGIRAMATTLGRMQEGCDPDKYYHVIRPYIDGFQDIVYEGVPEFSERPQSFRGQAAAQSSIVPSIVVFLGIAHETSGLTRHLADMRAYMPVCHREFIDSLGDSPIRHVVLHSRSPSLTLAYNACVEALMGFRRLHLDTVRKYIFERSGDAEQLGTGGTKYLEWLRQLADETDMHLLK